MRVTTPTSRFYLHAAVAAATMALGVAPCAARDCNNVGNPATFDPAPWTAETPSFNLAPACIDAPYAQTIVFRVPTTFSTVAGDIPLNALSIPVIGGIRNLPAGTTYVCDPPNCFFPAATCLVIHLYGTPTQGHPAPDTLDLVAEASLNTAIGSIPASFPGDMLPGAHYYLSLGTAGSCPTTTTSTTSTTSSSTTLGATTTTAPGGTSTTTTTSDVTTSTGGTSTTFAATTTTTLPDPCLGAIAVSKLGLGCSLDALARTLGSTAGLGKPAQPLAGLIAAARDRLDRSTDACAAAKLAPARKQALRAASAMKQFARKVRSRAARGAAAESRNALVTGAGHIEIDARAFTKGLTCPPSPAARSR